VPVAVAAGSGFCECQELDHQSYQLVQVWLLEDKSYGIESTATGQERLQSPDKYYDQSLLLDPEGRRIDVRRRVVVERRLEVGSTSPRLCPRILELERRLNSRWWKE